MRPDTYAAYEPVRPYFDLVRGALGDRVDGAHFFDVVADDIIYEVLYELPGWPRFVRGRPELMARFAAYGAAIALRAADHLAVHAANDGQTVIIEYEVHGTVLATGARYDNRFASVISLEGRKIARWRDYMDSHAAWNALSAPG